MSSFIHMDKVQNFIQPLSIETFVVEPTLAYVIIPLEAASFKHIPKFLLKKVVVTNLYFALRGCTFKK